MYLSISAGKCETDEFRFHQVDSANTVEAEFRAFAQAWELAMTSLHHLRIITQKELRALVPYTPQHILRLEKAGKFPRRLRLGENRVGWLLTDIEAWIASRMPVTYAAIPA